jgi:hypothetical protein
VARRNHSGRWFFFFDHWPLKTTWFWGINTQPLRGFCFFFI